MRAPSQGKRQKPLSEKHRKFTEEWVRTGNAKEACKFSGFSVETAADLVEHAGILKYKDKLEKQSTERAIERLDLTAEWVLKRFQQIAADGPDAKGGFSSQVQALDKLAKIMAMYPEEAGYQEGARQFPDGTMEVYRAKWLKKPRELPAGNSNVQ